MVKGQVLGSKPPGGPKVAAYHLFEGSESTWNETRQRILHETAGQYIGPTPVKDFFDEFMPWNNDVSEKWKEITVTQEQMDAIVGLPQCSEAESYPKFVSRLQTILFMCL